MVVGSRIRRPRCVVPVPPRPCLEPSRHVARFAARGIGALGDVSGAGWLLGLKAGAVAVVANAVLGMAKTLTPDARRATIAIGVMGLVLLIPGTLTMVAAIVVAGIAGYLLCRPPTRAGDDDAPAPVRLGSATAVVSLVVFALLFAGVPLLAAYTHDPSIGLFDTFYRAGSLVFGGGHVVLPLLQADTVGAGLVDPGMFLAGYGAAQAVPGPLFTFAAYLGAVTTGEPSPLVGAAVALIAIFLPSALLLMGVLPFWDRLRRSPHIQRALMGVNAGVVGLLAAALYTPVCTDGITGSASLVIAAAAFVALATWKTPAWAVVLNAAGLGALLL